MKPEAVVRAEQDLLVAQRMQAKATKRWAQRVAEAQQALVTALREKEPDD